MQTFNFADFFSRSSDVLPDDHDLFKALDRLPPVSENGPWLAGGALRRMLLKQPLDSDFDFFFSSQEQLDAFLAAAKLKGAQQIRENEHATTLRLPSVNPKSIGEDEFTDYLPEIEVQAISIQFYDSLDAVLDSFDFTICQFGYDGVRLVCGDHSLWDLGRRRLVPHRLTFATASMRRLLKYANQGFTICAGGLSDFLQQVAGDPSVINSETQYVD